LLTERRTELVRLSWWSWLVHGDGPGGVNLSPILGSAPLVDDAVKDVGVNNVRSSDRDVVARSRCLRRNEAAGIGVVTLKENPLPMLRNDLHDEMGFKVIGACLEPVGRSQERRKLGVWPQPHVDISVWLDLEAVHGSAQRATAIEHVEPTGEIDPRQRRTVLALACAEAELEDRDLDPVIGGHRQ
jgi:hypothetical protein